MVNERCLEKVLDPKMMEKPSSRVLKRALAVALRCVDLNSERRPKIGHVIHMLESQDQFSINVRSYIIWLKKITCYQGQKGICITSIKTYMDVY